MMPLLFIIFVLSLGVLSACQMLWKAFSTSSNLDFKTNQRWSPLCSGTIFLCPLTRGYSHADLCFLPGQENQSGPVRNFHRSHEHLGFHHGGTCHFPCHVSLSISSRKVGPSLLFIVLPQLFDKMPFGTIFYILFLCFSSLRRSLPLSLCLKSMGNITNQDNRKRAKWSAILGILTFCLWYPFSPHPMGDG